ncbi:MAG: hypothetical protein GQ564_17560 [Bacteroidales bacterium]|nr:hypothetical protein [Bacteroidales bacterium]
MKTFKNLCTIALFLVLSIVSVSLNAQRKTSKEYDPVVKELQELYNSNKDFKQLLDNALASAVPTPDGWSLDPNDDTKLYKWPDKNINDFLDFFQDWLHFVPDPTNGMDYYVVLYGLCYNNTNALKFVATEPGLSWTKKYVEARGDYMDSKESINDNIKTMDAWKEALGDAWDNFEPLHLKSKAYEGYTTFNEFFTRSLKDSTIRPISESDDPGILVSPADGLINIINENLNTESRIHTKYEEYLNVDQLLGGSEYAKYFIGGTATGTVLLPADYHHYHSPAEGKVVEAKAVDSEGGVYFGMDGQFFTYKNNSNVGGYMSDYGVFSVYHRGYYIIKTENFGYIAMIAVGLDDISSINFEGKFKPEIVAKQAVNVKKGERIGHFAYGGSTVILLFEAGVLDGLKLKQGAQIGVLNTK